MSNFITNIRLNNLQQEIDNIVLTGPLTNPLLKDMDCGGFGVDNAVFIQAASIITPSFTTTGIIADSVATDTMTSKTSGGPITFNSDANFTEGVSFSSVTFDNLTVTDLATVGSLSTTKLNVQSNIQGSLYVAQDSLLGGNVKMSKDNNLYTSNIFAAPDDITETINVRNTLNVGNETVDESTITGLITVGVVDGAGNTSGTLRVSHIQPTLSSAGGDAASLQFEVTSVKFDDEIIVQGYGTFGGAINTPIVNTDKIQTNTLGQNITLVGVLQGEATAIITGMSQIGGADIYGDIGSFTSIKNKENNGPPSLDFGLNANNHSIANASDIQLTLPASQDITIQANNINPSTGYPSLGLVWQHSGTNTSSVVYDTVFNVPPSVTANTLQGVLTTGPSAGGLSMTNIGSVYSNNYFVGANSGTTNGVVFDTLVNPVYVEGSISNSVGQSFLNLTLNTNVPSYSLAYFNTPASPPLKNCQRIDFYLSELSFDLGDPDTFTSFYIYLEAGANTNTPYNPQISPVYIQVNTSPTGGFSYPSSILSFINPDPTGAFPPTPYGLAIKLGLAPGQTNLSLGSMNNFTLQGTINCVASTTRTFSSSN